MVDTLFFMPLFDVDVIQGYKNVFIISMLVNAQPDLYVITCGGIKDIDLVEPRLVGVGAAIGL